MISYESFVMILSFLFFLSSSPSSSFSGSLPLPLSVIHLFPCPLSPPPPYFSSLAFLYFPVTPLPLAPPTPISPPCLLSLLFPLYLIYPFSLTPLPGNIPSSTATSLPPPMLLFRFLSLLHHHQRRPQLLLHHLHPSSSSSSQGSLPRPSQLIALQVSNFLLLAGTLAASTCDCPPTWSPRCHRSTLVFLGPLLPSTRGTHNNHDGGIIFKTWGRRNKVSGNPRCVTGCPHVRLLWLACWLAGWAGWRSGIQCSFRGSVGEVETRRVRCSLVLTCCSRTTRHTHTTQTARSLYQPRVMQG